MAIGVDWVSAILFKKQQLFSGVFQIVAFGPSPRGRPEGRQSLFIRLFSILSASPERFKLRQFEVPPHFPEVSLPAVFFLSCCLTIHIMKKFTLLTTALLLLLSSFCQDVKKISEQYQKDLADSVNFPYGNNKQAGKYYTIRGFKMYAEVYGEGQPLLIIHGNGGSINNFIYQIPYFGEKYKVIIADSRSQGKSKDSGDSLSYEMMADDYAALLDVMKIDSANVIGWSDGGINALLLAIRHPEKVKKMAVTGANLVPDTSAVPQSIWNMVMPTYSMLKNKKVLSEEEKGAYKLFRLLVEQPHIPVADLHKITCPSLVIGGDHDVIKEEHTFLIYKNIPKAYLWILPSSGHSTPIVYKDDFNTVIDRFFSNPYRTFNGEARFF
jgi:pimeloyl-ACP methyl ester carboxylesterase